MRLCDLLTIFLCLIVMTTFTVSLGPARISPALVLPSPSRLYSKDMENMRKLPNSAITSVLDHSNSSHAGNGIVSARSNENHSKGLDNPAFIRDISAASEDSHITIERALAAQDSANHTSSFDDGSKYSGGESCKARCFNKFSKIQWFVAMLGVYSFVEGASINGFVNISLTSLETRFQLKSSETGLIVSSADIGATVFVLFVSYYGAKTHQPRVVGAGCLVMALGSFLFFLPHLLVGNYTYTTGDSGVGHVCDSERADVCVIGNGQSSSDSAYLPLFAIAQAVQGIGFTPAFTVGAAYIDDHTTPERTAFYLGIVYSLAALGVAAGFMTGGQLLNLWVDIGRLDTSLIDLDPSDRLWVGAWWFGFVITCGLFVLFTVPLCAFPRRLPGSRKNQPKDVSASQESEKKERPLWKKLLSLPKSMLVLIKNPIFLLVLLAGSAETLVIQGVAAFSAKILEEKFDFNPADAGLVMGAVALGGGAGGMVLGGWLIKRFHLQIPGILKLCMAMAVLSLALGAGFFLNCPETQVAGLNWRYAQSPDGPLSPALTGLCNAECNCNTQEFDPVCGRDGVVYITPCHAGCNGSVNTTGGDKIFTNCSCVYTGGDNSTNTGPGLDGFSPEAVSGQCGTDCPLVWLFVVLLFCALLATFTTVTPISTAVLRCAPEKERSLGLGIQWVALRLLGTIPGPVLAGTVLDHSCILWQTTCTGQGNCWVYDRLTMSWTLFLWWALVKVLTFTMLSIAFYLCERKSNVGVITATSHTTNSQW